MRFLPTVSRGLAACVQCFTLVRSLELVLFQTNATIQTATKRTWFLRAVLVSWQL